MACFEGSKQIRTKTALWITLLSVGLFGVYPFKHFTHLLVHKIDRLKWTDHHTKFGDLASVIARDHVDAVDVLAFNGCLKFEYCVVAIKNLFGVAETFRGIV